MRVRDQHLDLDVCPKPTPWFECMPGVTPLFGYMPFAKSLVRMHAGDQLFGLDTYTGPTFWFDYMHGPNFLVWMHALPTPCIDCIPGAISFVLDTCPSQHLGLDTYPLPTP